MVCPKKRKHFLRRLLYIKAKMLGQKKLLYAPACYQCPGRYGLRPYQSQGMGQSKGEPAGSNTLSEPVEQKKIRKGIAFKIYRHRLVKERETLAQQNQR